MPAGRAGDRFGYKPLSLLGLTVFTLASVACGLSSNAGEMVAARGSSRAWARSCSRTEAGTASGILSTAAARNRYGIAIIGTVLFGALHLSSGPARRSLSSA